MASNELGTYQPGQHTTPDPEAEGIVFFFRSRMQSEGRPLAASGGPDTEYDKSFGFDIYRPEMYGDSQDMKDAYDSDASIGINVMNKDKTKIYQITPGFTLTDRRGTLPYATTYYRPNILIMPGETKTIYAKLFLADHMDKDRPMTVSISPETGIDTYTENITFAQQRIRRGNGDGFPVEEITITTKANETIPADATLTLTDSITHSTVGKCRLLPNQVYKPHGIIVEVTYNAAPAAPGNYQSLVTNVNEQALNQACIHLKTSNTTHTLRIDPTDKNLLEDSPAEFQTALSGNNGIEKFHLALETIEYKFFEQYANELIKEIESLYRNTEVEISPYDDPENKTMCCMLHTDETIKSILNKPTKEEQQDIDDDIKNGGKGKLRNNYLSSFTAIIKYFIHNRLNYFPIFKLNLDTAISELGRGYERRCFVMERNSFNETMRFAHEFGHNLSLKHPFYDPKQPHMNDLTLQQAQTLENIMDYLPGNPPPYTGWIHFHWDKMRREIDKYTDNVDDFTFNITIGGNAIDDSPNDYVNTGNSRFLGAFSESVLRYFLTRKFGERVFVKGNETIPDQIIDLVKKKLNKIRQL